MNTSLGGIIFVVCNNDDFFHEKGHYHLQHIIYGGATATRPNREETQEILDSLPGVPVLMIVTPCESCRNKGITGPSGFDTVER